jgi:hypothetical protein
MGPASLNIHSTQQRNTPAALTDAADDSGSIEVIEAVRNAVKCRMLRRATIGERDSTRTQNGTGTEKVEEERR